jgi:RHH-type rel operon transcriptional repressor/antitoxin RelB
MEEFAMAIRPSPEIEQRLEALARETGRSMAQLAREVVFQHIDAIEDYYLNGDREHDNVVTAYGTEFGVDLGL